MPLDKTLGVFRVSFPLAAALIACATTTSVCAQDEVDAATHKSESIKTFNDIYGEQIKSVKATPELEDDLQLASDFLAATETISKDTAMVIHMCEQALKLVSRAPQGMAIATTAAEIIKVHAPHAQQRFLAAMGPMLERRYERARGQEEARIGLLLLQSLDAQAQIIRSAGDYAKALSIRQQAYRTASKLKKQVAPTKLALDRAVAEMRAGQKAAALKRYVKANPEKQDALDKLIDLLMFELDEPTQAAEYALNLTDAKLQKMILLANSDPADMTPADLLSVGKWYMDSVQKVSPASRAPLLVKAVDYFEYFHEKSSDMSQLQLIKVNLYLKRSLGDLKTALNPTNSRSKPNPWNRDCQVSYSFDQSTFFKNKQQVLLRDLSGNKRHGLIVDGTLKTGKIGQALAFNGKSTYVRVPPFPLGGGVTVSAWVSSSNPTAQWARIIDFGNGPDKGNIVVGWSSTTGNLVVFTSTLGGTRSPMPSLKAAFPKNQWVHVTTVFEPSGDVTMYVNGNSAMRDKVTALENTIRRHQYIGRSNWKTDIFFPGSMDEFAVWNRALTSKEVASLYSTSSRGRSYAKNGPSDTGTVQFLSDQRPSTPESDLRPLLRQYVVAKAGEKQKQIAGQLVDGLLAVADNHGKQKRWNEAIRVYRRATTLAGKVSATQAEAIKTRIESAQAALALAERMARLLATYKADPNNKQVAGELAMTYLVVFDDHAEAEKYSLSAGDDELSSLIDLSGQDIRTLSDQAINRLAQWYQQLAKDQPVETQIVLLSRSLNYLQFRVDKLAADEEFDDELNEQVAALTIDIKELLQKTNGAWPDVVQKTALKTHLLFDQATDDGQSVTDQSPDGSAGMMDSVAFSPWRGGEAANFSAESSITMQEPLEIKRGKGLTVSMWVRPQRDAGTLIQCMTDGDSPQGFSFSTYSEDLRGTLRSGVTSRLTFSARNAMEPGSWRHVAITYDGGTREEGFVVYVNGQQVDANVDADRFTVSMSVEAPVTLGARGESKSFVGYIDDVRIYERQLTANEIASLHRLHRPAPKAPAPN